uniref:Uncharacterized protein n=1 Tax=viral metagenome TaxID=1070528 RepID=A0A6C0I4P6_9ZZZZ
MQQITFYDNRGRMETADMKEIVFSDGIKRAICTHSHIPDAYLPRDVYQLKSNGQGNGQGNECTKVGTYTTAETKSTQWFNAHTNAWEGIPGNECYIFHEN